VTNQWVLRLQFCWPPSVHFLPGRDEQNARTRAAWWMQYRDDVIAEAVLWREDGLPGTRRENYRQVPQQRTVARS
jgi:hypothetical protein